jgi:propanediol dehydratase small subunit
MENRLGITLTDDERKFLVNTRQEKADKIAKDKWHCFDIPFNMVCGSRDFAMKVYEVLKPYSSQMVEQLQVSIES